MMANGAGWLFKAQMAASPSVSNADTEAPRLDYRLNLFCSILGNIGNLFQNLVVQCQDRLVNEIKSLRIRRFWASRSRISFWRFIVRSWVWISSSVSWILSRSFANPLTYVVSVLRLFFCLIVWTSWIVAFFLVTSLGLFLSIWLFSSFNKHKETTQLSTSLHSRTKLWPIWSNFV